MRDVDQPVVVKDLIEYLSLKQITGDEKSLQREVVIADTNRPGLELTGYFDDSHSKRVILLGNMEIGYIKTMSIKQQEHCFDFITHDDTPAIIISKDHTCPEVLKDIANRKNFPIFSSERETSRLIVDLTSYLDEVLAEYTCLHGGLLSIYGKGVMIKGESGVGKSEIALDLIKRGHQLIADDRVDCYKVHNNIIAESPELLKGMLEIRGIGIINVSRMFGASTVLDKGKIDFVVSLEKWDTSIEYDRIGTEEKKYENILGVNVPKICLPVREGRTMAAIIESAVTNFTLTQMGMDSAKEFEERVLAHITKKNENKVS